MDLVKGGVRHLKSFTDNKLAIQARRRGENVRAESRQLAGKIERGAADNPNDVIRDSGHKLKDGSGKTGLPHFQTKGQRGHTFYSGASVILGGLIVALEIADNLDPFHVTRMGCGSLDCNNSSVEIKNSRGSMELRK